MYRLVDRGWATLGEIRTMTFDDLDLAILAADAIDVAHEDAERRRGTGAR